MLILISINTETLKIEFGRRIRKLLDTKVVTEIVRVNLFFYESIYLKWYIAVNTIFFEYWTFYVYYLKYKLQAWKSILFKKMVGNPNDLIRGPLCSNQTVYCCVLKSHWLFKTKVRRRSDSVLSIRTANCRLRPKLNRLWARGITHFSIKNKMNLKTIRKG